jgi:hypothetical protein
MSSTLRTTTNPGAAKLPGRDRRSQALPGAFALRAVRLRPRDVASVDISLGQDREVYRQRWFGLDDQNKVRCDWDEGRRLRGWVARTDTIDAIIAGREDIFGEKVTFPTVNSSFDFTIPNDGSLPSMGQLPLSSTGVASLARWPQLSI